MKKKISYLLLIPIFAFAFSLGQMRNSVFLSTNSSYSAVFASETSDQFLDYWENTFRAKYPDSVCEASYEDYVALINLYSSLSTQDKDVVNATKDSRDEQYTVGYMIQQLVNKYYPNNKKHEQNKSKLDQKTTIIIAVVVSIFGMSAISVLYILKNNKYIK